MLNLIYQLIRTARPRQWLKNLSVFAPALFAGQLFEMDVLIACLKALVVFCAVASAGYFINDIVDAPSDALHPVKKNRPIPSGMLSAKLAAFVAALLAMFSISYAILYMGNYVAAVIITYIIIQFIYSFYLRNIIIIDALVVATLFIIRVFGGGLAAEVSVSSWLVLTTIGLSLLLAFGKRRSEKTLLNKYDVEAKDGVETRKTLRHYPDSLLDSMISMSAAFCIITYSLFVFQISPEGFYNSHLATLLPSILQTPKLMMLTIPLVIYGVARYLYVIYEKKEGESPERVLLSDKPLLATVVLWGVTTVGIVYILPLLNTLQEG